MVTQCRDRDVEHCCEVERDFCASGAFNTWALICNCGRGYMF